MYSKHCGTFKMERFAKRIMPDCSWATRNFSWQGGRRLDFTKNTRKRGLGGHSFFNGKFSPKMDTIRAFLSKIKKLFLICIKDRGGWPSPLVVHLQVWLNMLQYPWKCLNKHAWINCFDYARALNMHDHLTFSTGFWRCLGF